MPRRERGTGGVYERTLPGGRVVYVAQIVREGTRQTRMRRTRREANAALVELRRAPVQAAGAKARQRARMTVADYLETWLAGMAPPRLKPRSWESYAARLRGHVYPVIGAVLLADLTPRDVQRVQTSLARQGLAASTINVTLAVLSSALQQAEDFDELPRNPARKVKRLPEARPDVETFTVAEARRVLALFSPTRHGGPVVLALLYGLRQSEALGVRWADVGDGSLTIAGQLARHREHTSTKGNRPRVLPLLPPVEAVLRAQRVRQAEDRLRYGPRWTDSGYVWTGPMGKPLHHRDLTKCYTRTLAAAGLPHRHMHALRHGTASLLTSLGVPALVVAAILGHARLEQTGHYVSVDLGTMRQALERLGDALEG